jgi:hypothetical protein
MAEDSLSTPTDLWKDIRRVQAQGIQVFRLIYLSGEEFEFLKLKRLEFLKRVGYFGKKPPEGRKGGKKEALRGSTNEDHKTGRGKYTPCYEPTNIEATRDSLFWSWRRVSEYYRDFLDEEDGKRKEVIRIDPRVRKS